MKKIIFMLLMAVTMLSMSGCGKKKIFEDPNDAFMIKAVEDGDLEKDTYYVKDGTKFYAVYKPEGSSSGKAIAASSDRLYWTFRDFGLIPTYYKDELIAYPSERTSVEDISVERFKDLGWSLGIRGATIDQSGYIAFSAKQNCVKTSDIYNKLIEQKSDAIRIVAINGQEVTPENLLPGGVLAGMEEEGIYELSYYAGTYYGTIKAVADRRFFQSYEIYSIDKGEDTKNGYMTLKLQDDAKSGYYMIDGAGMFVYYDTPKAQVSAEVDMNEPFYESLADQLYANSQQYVISVPTVAESASFNMSYDPQSTNNPDEVTAILTAPNGITYDMQQGKGSGQLLVEIDNVMSGKWTLNIMPKDIIVKDVFVDPVYKSDESTKETFTYTLEENTNVKFAIGYEGEGEVWGTITFEDGTTNDFVTDTKNKQLSYTYNYLQSGTYTVDIYHYADTSIEDEVNIGEDADNIEEEIITIEG